MLKNLLRFWIEFSTRNRYAGLLLPLFPGLIALSCFLFFNSLLVRALSLLVALRFISMGILGAIDLSIFPMGAGNRKRLATSISAGSMFLFLILYTQTVILAALAWVMFLINVAYGLRAIARIAMQGMILPRLLICYRRREFQNLRLPLVYVVSEPEFNPYYENKLTQEISLRLSKLNITLPTLTFSSIQTQSVDFQKWIVSQAAALIIIRRPLPVKDPAFEQRLFEYQALCVGGIFFLYAEPRKLKAKFISEHDDVNVLLPWFSSETTALEELTSGQLGQTANQVSDGLSGSAVKFVDHFTSTIQPTSESDSQLPIELRGVIPVLASDGLRPVANCYLRFRSA